MNWLDRRNVRWECTANCAYWMFMAVLPVQAVHMLEHTIQLNQHVLGVRPALGLLGQYFDTVAVHVVFNVGIFLVLAFIWGLWRTDPAGWRTGPGGWFTGLVLFQAYHAAEHIVQGYQAWVMGMAAPPGIIGQVLPNVAAHYQLNLILTALIVAVAVALRPGRLPVPTAAAA